MLSKKDTAIEVLRQSLQIHVSWLAYYEKHIGAEDLPENMNAGNAEHQRMCIDNYERAIAEVEGVKAFVVCSRDELGSWMSAALEDEKVCDEMKAVINKWFELMPKGM